MFASGADRRNEILEMVFGNVVNSKVFETIKSVSRVTTEAIDKVTDLGQVVNDVLSGKYGNGVDRWNKLTEEGYDWVRVQNLVNEAKGCAYRREEEVSDAINGTAEATDGLTESTLELNDAILREIGLTEEEIEYLKGI